MSYQAIARKWRPQTFEEIAGQSHVTRTLTNALKKGRIHHAFLFTGPRGVGKTTAARAMARCLNCGEGTTPTPCGSCASCMETATGVSPDVIEIDGASNNTVDDVRELRDSVQYLPSKGNYRVFIIDEVHMLSKSAFNALLKTLEEPPAHVVFIFATTEPQKIPETVLSRVQRFDFKRIPVSVVAERLGLICEAEKVRLSPASLRMIARAGEGSMRDAQSLLDQVIAFAGEEADDSEVAQILGLVDRSLLYQMLEGLLQGKPDQSLEAIATVYEHGYELAQFTSEILELVRNAALASLSPSSKAFLDITEDERTRLLSLSEGVGVEVFSRYFDVLMDVHDTVSKSSRPRLVLEMAVARLATTRSVQPVGALMKRLEGMERRLRTGGASSPRPQVHQSRGSSGPRRSEAAETTAPVSEPEPEPEPASESVSDKEIPSPELSLAPPVEAVPEVLAEPAIVPVPEPEPEPESSFSAEAPANGQASTEAPNGQASTEIPELAPVPIVAPGASEAERYSAFVRHLRAQGVRFRTITESSVMLEYQGGVLDLGFVSERTLRRGGELSTEKDVLQFGQIFFPELRRIRARLRPEDNVLLTAKESHERDKKERAQSLWDEAKADPALQEVCARLEGTIESVTPLEE